MHLDLTNLPRDTTMLHQLVRNLAEGMEQRDGEIEKLRQHRQGSDGGTPTG